jgi:hypothetical protein
MNGSRNQGRFAPLARRPRTRRETRLAIESLIDGDTRWDIDSLAQWRALAAEGHLDIERAIDVVAAGGVGATCHATVAGGIGVTLRNAGRRVFEVVEGGDA